MKSTRVLYYWGDFHWENKRYELKWSILTAFVCHFSHPVYETYKNPIVISRSTLFMYAISYQEWTEKGKISSSGSGGVRESEKDPRSGRAFQRRWTILLFWISRLFLRPLIYMTYMTRSLWYRMRVPSSKSCGHVRPISGMGRQASILHMGRSSKVKRATRISVQNEAPTLSLGRFQLFQPLWPAFYSGGKLMEDKGSGLSPKIHMYTNSPD